MPRGLHITTVVAPSMPMKIAGKIVIDMLNAWFYTAPAIGHYETRLF
jgi:hypothetical protein